MSIKSQLRPLINFAADFGGVLRRREVTMAGGMTILTYHRVLDDAHCEGYPFDSLVMPVTVFAEQMNWIFRHCDVQTIADGMRTSMMDVRGPRPRVCICFDDGYEDNYHLAAPILEKCGIHGTFFVTAGMIENKTPLWFDWAAIQWEVVGRDEILRRVAGEFGHASKIPNISSKRGWVQFLKGCDPNTRERLLYQKDVAPDGDLAKVRLMTVAQVRDLHQRGHEIGSHTLTHPLLPQLRQSDLNSELVGSRERLKAWLGEEVAGIAYPNGDCDERVVAAARAAGYQYGCTTLPGLNSGDQDPMLLRRIHVRPHRVTLGNRHDERGFRAEISGLYARSN